MNSRRTRRKTRAAFTLMEVMLVLVILVIMGGLAVSVFQGQQSAALKRSAQVQVDTLSNDCLRYQADMFSFPPSLAELRYAPAAANASNWAGPYTGKEVGADPWGNPYQYQYPGTRYQNEKPDIWSYGPDGQNGTEDDIYNQ
jgi:general secretion pathway protein G